MLEPIVSWFLVALQEHQGQKASMDGYENRALLVNGSSFPRSGQMYTVYICLYYEDIKPAEGAFNS